MATYAHNISTPEKLAEAEKRIKQAMMEKWVPLSEIGYNTETAGEYEKYLAHIWEKGVPKVDRTGTGTISVFGYQMRFDLQKCFPLITTKKVHTKSIFEELIWFLKGEDNIKYLQEHGVTIWDEWAKEDGSLGPVYGVQWRSWPAPDGKYIDQIAEVIKTLKSNPDSRRIIVSAWNVADLDKMALMPCHAFFQFYVAEDKLSCQLYQRSCDSFLGVPFNIASYASLNMMIAQQCDLGLGEFIWTGGDCHIYSNHFDQVKLQLSREPRPYPTMKIRGKPNSIDEYTLENFVIDEYYPHPHIRGAVAK